MGVQISLSLILRFMKIYPEVEFLDSFIILFLSFLRTILLPIAATPSCIVANTV